MGILTNLNLINTYKGNIKDAIEAKGVDMTNIPLSGYAGKIGEISGSSSPIYLKIYEFENGYWKNLKARTGRYVKVQRGQTITLPSGVNVSETSYDSISNPSMTFDSWDSPITIVNNTITVPNDWIGDIEIYANYSFSSNCYVRFGVSTITSGDPSNTSYNYVVYRTNWTGMPASGELRTMINNVIFSSDFTPASTTKFFDCYRSVNQIVLPKSITSIGKDDDNTINGFRLCANLTNIHLPNTMTQIRGNSFENCYNLTDVNMPSSLTYIGSNAFENCRGLVSLTFYSGLETIKSNAFSGCDSLNDLHFRGTTPPTLENVNAFPSQTKIYVPESAVNTYKTSSVWSSISSRIYPEVTINADEMAISIIQRTGTILYLPPITKIGDSCFRGYSSLVEVHIPNTVTTIESYSFSYCSNLTSIYFSSDLTSVPTLKNTNAFSNTNNFKVYVPDSLLSAFKSTGNWSSFSSKIFPLS